MDYQRKQLHIRRLKRNFTPHHDLVMQLQKDCYMKTLELSSLESIQGGGGCCDGINLCGVLGGTLACVLGTVGCVLGTVSGLGCASVSVGICAGVGVHI